MTQERINQYLRAFEKFEKAIDMLDMMDAKYPKKLKKELELVAWSVISDWYDSYEPHAYRRREDLFNVYKIIVTPSWFSIKFDSSYMENWHHQDQEIIYNNAFKLGYHGGSLGIGLDSSEPHWRRPHKYFTEWFDTPAIQSFSPFERMKEEMEETISKIDDEYNKDMKKVQRLVKAGINEIRR